MVGGVSSIVHVVHCRCNEGYIKYKYSTQRLTHEFSDANQVTYIVVIYPQVSSGVEGGACFPITGVPIGYTLCAETSMTHTPVILVTPLQVGPFNMNPIGLLFYGRC